MKPFIHIMLGLSVLVELVEVEELVVNEAVVQPMHVDVVVKEVLVELEVEVLEVEVEEVLDEELLEVLELELIEVDERLEVVKVTDVALSVVLRTWSVSGVLGSRFDVFQLLDFQCPTIPLL